MRKLSSQKQKKILTHAELDRRLDPSALEPESFEALAEKVMNEMDKAGMDLEIRDAWSWRKSGGRRTGTGSVSNPLQQFRSDVEDIEILGREDEAQLARRIEFARMRLERARRADPRSDRSPEPRPRDVARRALELSALRTEMVERNLYLVLINVERYVLHPANRHDLIQEGNLALFRAVDGFDWRRGLLFRTYAVHWLNQAFRN